MKQKGSDNTKSNDSDQFNKKALTAALKSKGYTNEDEIESKIQAIMAVMES